MFWVLVFGGIALAGVVMVVCYGVWLFHKAADLMSELGVLGERLAQLGGLAAAIRPTEYATSPDGFVARRPTEHGVGSEDQT